MKALIFNGALERRENATSERLSRFLSEYLHELGIETSIFKIADAGIPLFDVSLQKTPNSVVVMNHVFREADVHIWLTPLYHGSMTGVMKNCLDWLQYSANLPKPYLIGKIIGLVCWADGVQAMQGINAMDAVAKALRAWTAPLSIPIERSKLFDENGEISSHYKDRFTTLLQLLTEAKV
ncbi:NAD(P)H-dependent oxidoreductase [Limibacter armeniacum]|uniref:NADPH-dependent FMN reductase n=1 Tax=Limibacter armeniacum TaxID=466084 RepID=UPI002FE61993